MPCRLASYISISDDALHQGYRRFAKACSPTRRHGSSVPGPLEARRRLAKRRMVGLAMAGAGPSLMPDFGALFGSGGIDMTSLWKPPTDKSHPPLVTSPLPTSTHGLMPVASPPPTSTHSQPLVARPPPPSTRSLPLAASHARSVDEYKSLLQLQTARSLSDVQRVHGLLHGPDADVPVHFSKAAFSCLKDNVPDQILLDFLESDMNHDQSGNTHAYLAHLYTRQLLPQALEPYVRLVCDKIALHTIPHAELLKIIHDLPHAPSEKDNQIHMDLALFNACRLLQTSLADRYAPNPPPVAISVKLLRAFCFLVMAQLPDVNNHVRHVYEWLPRNASSHANKTFSSRLCSIFLAQSKSLEPSDPLVAFLQSLPPDHLPEILRKATVDFLSFLQRKDPPTTADQDPNPQFAPPVQRLLYLLNHLHQHLPGVLTPFSPTAQLLYPLLASHHDPSDLAPFFDSIDSTDAATAILHYWLKPALLNPSESDVSAHSRRAVYLDGPFQTYGITYTVARHPKPPPTWSSDVFDDITTVLKERTNRDAFLHLSILLSRHGVESSFWLDQVFQIFIHTKPSVKVYHFFKALVDSNVPIPYAVASRLIHFFLDAGTPSWAFAVYDRPNAQQWISYVPELIFSFIDQYPIKSEFLFKILNRPEYANSIPMPLRTTPNNTLSQDRVNLIHHIAYALAKSPHLTSLLAFRRVCDCLHYLQDRGAPLSSLMSRALVFAGVTRPLQEGRWVSTMKFKWILDFVHKLEGEEVAQKLDEVAYTLRSRNLENNRAELGSLEAFNRGHDLMAWEYRKRCGHRSSRWKRKTKLYKPWTSKKNDDVKT